MRESVAERASLASEAQREGIVGFLHDPAPAVTRALLGNRNLTEEHILILANRKDLLPEFLELISRDRRWAESYPVRLALAKNPRTPLFVAVTIARFLRLFDLADITRKLQLPVLHRKKLEAIVIEKVPTLPLGVKKTLAKIAAGEILLSLIRDGYPEVVNLCLDNPRLVEPHLYKVISRETTSPSTIRIIANHAGWSRRYQIRTALIRNLHCPLSRAAVFVLELKLYDLIELYHDPLLPPAVRPVIHRELLKRGKDPDRLCVDISESCVYEVNCSDEPKEESEKGEGSIELKDTGNLPDEPPERAITEARNRHQNPSS